MSKEAKKPAPRRAPERTILKIEADGFYTVIGGDIDVYVMVVPDCPGHEDTAEHVAELMIPLRFRKTYNEGKVNATGIVRKLKPSALLAARHTALSIAELNKLKGGGR